MREFTACTEPGISFNLPSDGELKARAHASDLNLAPKVHNSALSSPLVEAVAGYLGTVPVLGILDLRASGSSQDTGGYQLFHVDMEDFRQAKVIIAINDIDDSAGPTTIVPAGRSSEVRRVTDTLTTGVQRAK